MNSYKLSHLYFNWNLLAPINKVEEEFKIIKIKNKIHVYKYSHNITFLDFLKTDILSSYHIIKNQRNENLARSKG